ncbi:phosphatidylglycerophosphate synthase [freshwater metagenome]|uniref:Phosphatidylglycerophosphate synthase n=1 Tax=freshwater metagenome TaxID=449393 RepID=A0A094NZ49_9ZZZZ
MLKRGEILTIPNAITGVRALGIPLFLWAYLSVENTGLALTILIIGAVSDYFDGKVARLLNQESALGAALDPTIDRLYIAATVIALVIKEVVPLWLLILLISRDLWMALVLAIKKARGAGVFEVTFLGKAATFNLLYAFPFLLVAGDSGIGEIFFIAGWGFAIWGIVLYWVTGLQYTYVAIKEIKSNNSPN